LNFWRKNELVILQNAVRADIFKKCFHFLLFLDSSSFAA
jgi:hypothetical protein